MPRQSDFLHGIVISAACSALPVRKKLPTAYSYNGVVLPKLPEWDRSVYPYAVIYHRETATTYCLLLMSEPVTCYSGGSLKVGILGTPMEVSSYISFLCEDGVWVEGKTKGVQLSIPDWTNKDLHYEEDAGGGLRMAGSEPVPVYE